MYIQHQKHLLNYFGKCVQGGGGEKAPIFGYFYSLILGGLGGRLRYNRFISFRFNPGGSMI